MTASQAERPVRNHSSSVRVLAVIDNLAVGGAEALLSEFALGAQQAAIELHVLNLGYEGVASERLRHTGTPVFCIPPRQRLQFLDLMAVARTVRVIRRVKPDLVHTHLSRAAVFAGAAAWAMRVPTVATVHENSFDVEGRRRYRLRLGAVARRLFARRVISVATATRDDYLERRFDRPERVVVVHNGISDRRDEGAGAAVRQRLGISADDFVVGMVAAFRPEKGHDIAATAMSRVMAQRPDVHFVVVGDGPDSADIRARLNIGSRTHLTGAVVDVMPLLDAFDVLILPSRAEALPTVLIEAMASGLPFIASDVGGVRELLNGVEVGLLLAGQPSDRELERKLTTLIDSPSLRRQMGEEGRRRFLEHFSLAAWVERTRQVYDEVLAGA
jgi:glycosyltransferase involved in cell wall biosynthesis